MLNQGRNEKCSCNSGLKYKKCCLVNEQKSMLTQVVKPYNAKSKIVLGDAVDVQFETQQRVISELPNDINCVERSMSNANLFGNDTEWGTLLVFDKINQQFEAFYQSHHMWNVSKDGSVVYDDIDLLNKATKQYKFVCKDANEWDVKVVDGSNIQCGNSGHEAYWKVVDTITPKYKGKCDAIYLKGFAVNLYMGNKNYTQSDIDLMVESLTII